MTIAKRVMSAVGAGLCIVSLWSTLNAQSEFERSTPSANALPLMTLLVFGGIVAMFAVRKGYGGLLWFIYGFLLFPIALLHILLRKKNSEIPKNKAIASNLENSVRSLPDFRADDVYVSPYNLSGIAIDREQAKAALIAGDQIDIIPANGFYKCELLQDGVQIARANRGSQLLGIAVGGALLGKAGAMIGGLSGSSTISENFHRVVLRLVVDHFDRPVHETVLVDSERALAKDNKLYKEAVEKAELWYGRVIGLMQKASEQPRELPSSD